MTPPTATAPSTAATSVFQRRAPARRRPPPPAGDSSSNRTSPIACQRRLRSFPNSAGRDRAASPSRPPAAWSSPAPPSGPQPARRRRPSLRTALRRSASRRRRSRTRRCRRGDPPAILLPAPATYTPPCRGSSRPASSRVLSAWMTLTRSPTSRPQAPSLSRGRSRAPSPCHRREP